MIGRTVTNAVVIPTAALRQSQQSPVPFVYRINDDVVEHAPVTLGVVDEGRGSRKSCRVSTRAIVSSSAI